MHTTVTLRAAELPHAKCERMDPAGGWTGPPRHQRLASTVTRTEPQVAVRAQGAAPEPGIRRVRPEFSRWPRNLNGNRY
jgi:hypothetical protein